jgi:magnesium and cobalt transporter
VEKIGENKWRVSGLVPVHDLPDQINLFEDEDDTATVGGVVTKELGRIPENQEILELAGLQIKILEADDTRVLSLEIQMVDKETAISEETE